MAPAIAGIKTALKETGRRIDADHYGASFHVRFGSWEESLMQRMAETCAMRFQREPRDSIVAGDTADIMRRIEAFVAADASKFVLWPIGSDDDDFLDQTRRLIAKVQPAVDAPFARATVADAVEACMAAIEIVDDRYEDFHALDTPTLIADDFFSAGAVVGPPVAGWRDLALAVAEASWRSTPPASAPARAAT